MVWSGRVERLVIAVVCGCAAVVLMPRRADASCGYRVYEHHYFTWCYGDSTDHVPGEPWVWGCCASGGTYEPGECVVALFQTSQTFNCDGTEDDPSPPQWGGSILWWQPWGAVGKSGTIYPAGVPIDSNCHEPYCIADDPMPPPGVCDGLESDPGDLVDPGCGGGNSGEDQQCRSLGDDEHPLRFINGFVTTNPITAFSAPTPDGAFFGVRTAYNSHDARVFAHRQNDPAPTIRGPNEETHWLGTGWTDNTSDRLIFEDDRVVWRRETGFVTFLDTGSGYESPSKSYRLYDLGSGANPRYLIRDALGTRLWGFARHEFNDRTRGAPNHLGLLTRFALTAGAVDTTGYYWISISRVADGRVATVSDVWGRQLQYVYTSDVSNGPQFHRLSRIDYVHTSGSSPVSVAHFHYNQAPDQLALISFGDTYRRFRYLDEVPDRCANCSALMTEVIEPAAPFTSLPQYPATVAGPMAHERVLEGHEYEFIEGSIGPVARGVRTWGLNREWAYVYDSANQTTQLDLHQPGVSCAQASCAYPSSCWSSADGGDDTCYAATTITFNSSTAQVLQKTGTCEDCPVDLDYHSSGPAKYALKASTDPAGIVTTYAYDANGNVRCMVTNDDDQNAAVDPTDPASPCDPPASGPYLVTEVATLSNSTYKYSPSILNPSETAQSFEIKDSRGLVTSAGTVGWTQDIDGTLRSETRATTYTYDSYGRLLTVDGPRNNAEAYDVTTYEYWGSGTPNHGHLRYVRRYVGTAASNYALVTEYQNYDNEGIARTVIGPDGATVTLSETSNLVWQITVSGAGTSQSSEVGLYPDGRMRYSIDPDGVCTTVQYGSPPASPTSVPTVIARVPSTSSACGQLPIDTNVGEVEVRIFDANEPERLARVERYLDGALHYQVDGFVYTPQRQLQEVDSPFSANNVLLGYTDGLLTSVRSPDWPASDAWRTEMDIDELGRPTAYRHGLSSGGEQVHSLGYATSSHSFPTTITRGLNGANATTTTYKYDDFGGIVEVISPDHGTVRWEYDVAGNPIKHRIGIGTPMVQTSLSSFDSLGRLTYVDNDIEHPVNCATAAPGTLIGDEEHVYDSCPTGQSPAGFSCSNTTGKLAITRNISHCESSTIQKYGRWYNYDGLGRVTEVAVAQMSGSSIGTPTTIDYAYTSGSRISSIATSLSPNQPTTYVYGALGKPSRVRQHDVSQYPFTSHDFATEIGYRPFGPLSFFEAQTIGSRLQVGHDLHYALQTLGWKFIAAYTYSYNGAGLMTYRQSQMGAAQSKFYRYDNLMRLTCEATGSGSTHPVAGDCSQTKPRVTTLLTYTQGQSASDPPDNRKTAFLKSAAYTSPSLETYAYTSGSGKVTQVSRPTGGNVVMQYDALGRRTSDWLSTNQSGTQRTYGYYPNGLLASVNGALLQGGKYIATIRYDTENRPVRIETPALYETRELLWDDADRLLSQRITLSDRTILWTYHYLDSQPIGATRAVTIGSMTTTTRYSLLFDERGLITEARDGSTTAWAATYTAFGERTVTSSSTDMSLPFLFPGQVILSESSVAIDTATSGPVVLNHRRAYLPRVGTFLQPDPADQAWRANPEGYVYARNSPMVYADPTGASSEEQYALTDSIANRAMRGLEVRCNKMSDLVRVSAALYRAARDIATCSHGLCGESSLYRRRWVQGLRTGVWQCSDEHGIEWEGEQKAWAIGTYLKVEGLEVHGFTWLPQDLVGISWGALNAHSDFLLGRNGVYANMITGQGVTPTCLERLVAHEALHKVREATKESEVFSGGQDLPISLGGESEELRIDIETALCVKCKNTY